MRPIDRRRGPRHARSDRAGSCGRGLLIPLALAGLVACGDSEVAGPEPAGVATVMTRNLYLGTDLEPILDVESLSDLPAAVADAWANVELSDFPGRAEALADEIALARPHLVGLQEVALFRIQSPGDFFLGDLVSADDVALDFLGVLLDALVARGLDYSVAAVATGVDVEVPMLGPGGLVDIRLTDREIVLARADVRIRRAEVGTFVENVMIPVADLDVLIELPRAWVDLNADVAGKPLRFVSTHLETAEVGPEVQLNQAEELIDRLRVAGVPVVWVGDFNTAADGSTTATYDRLIGAGFLDAWSTLRPGRAGHTCCHASDLRNPTSTPLSRRIDLVLYRGATDPIAVTRTGVDPDERPASGLWPSDHAGVQASFRIH